MMFTFWSFLLFDGACGCPSVNTESGAARGARRGWVRGVGFGSRCVGVGFGSRCLGVEFGSRCVGVGFGSRCLGVGFGSRGLGVESRPVISALFTWPERHTKAIMGIRSLPASSLSRRCRSTLAACRLATIIWFSQRHWRQAVHDF